MENLGDVRSEYIRVELKTTPVDLPQKDVRLTPAEPSFENEMVRISRHATGGAEQYPSVYVVLGTGQSVFVPEGQTYHSVDRPLVKVELKTAPR